MASEPGADRTQLTLSNGRKARIAIVHDWIAAFGGAERCLVLLHELFPTAPIYTLVHDRRQAPPELSDAHIIASVLQNFPGALRDYQKYLPLMPFAIEQFDMSGYDLIISSSHAVAKGVLTHHRQQHLSYCYTPMRYVWDLYQTYLEHTRLSPLAEFVFRGSAHYLRQWDVASARRVDKFLAISQTVQQRIKRTYDREAPVVYPPVDTQFWHPEAEGMHSYFLVVSRFVPYKRVDLAIDVLAARDERMLIVGGGPLEARLKARATRNVEFVGAVTDEELRSLYQNCRALIFPAEEDFGLTPVECMACGRPVIALGYGGASETVIDGETGVHFPEQTAVALDEALDRFNKLSFDPETCRRRALTFDQSVFLSKIYAAAKYMLEQV